MATKWRARLTALEAFLRVRDMPRWAVLAGFVFGVLVAAYLGG